MADKEKKRSKEDWVSHVEQTSDDWEPEGKMGNDPKFMERRPSSVGNKRNSADIRSIRIDEQFLKEIKEVAQEEGFDSYQSFIKVILKRYINDKKKKA